MISIARTASIVVVYRAVVPNDIARVISVMDQQGGSLESNSFSQTILNLSIGKDPVSTDRRYVFGNLLGEIGR